MAPIKIDTDGFVSGCWCDEIDRALKTIGKTHKAAVWTLGNRQARANDLDPLLHAVWSCEALLIEIERGWAK